MQREGRDFEKKNSDGQLLKTLAQNQNHGQYRLPPHLIAKPTASSRRPLRMMHTSSYIRASELIELD